MSLGGSKTSMSGLIVAAIIGFGALFLANILVSGNLKNLLLWTGVALLPLAFVKWRQTLLFIPIWLLMEGLVRKFLFKSVTVLFFKDMLLLVVYFRLILEQLSQGRSFIPKTPINIPMLILFLWYCFELFNPNLTSTAIGLVGLKVIFFYFPYFYLTRFLFEDKEAFLRYLRIFLVCSIPIAILAYYQFHTGSDPGAFDPPMYEMETGEKVIRPSSTFFYNSYFGQYAFLTFFVIIGVINLRFFYKKWLLMLTIFVSNILSLMISGQRSAWATILAQISAMMILSPLTPKKYSFIPKLAFLSFFAIVIILAALPKSYESFQRRIDSTLENPEESGYIFTYRMESVSLRNIWRTAPWIGHGPGTATPASRHLDKYMDSSKQPAARAEGGYVQMWWEIGLIGMLIFAIMLLLLLKYTFEIRKTLHDTELKQVSIMGTLVCSGYMMANITAGMLNNSSTAILFWFLMGIIPALPALDKKNEKTLDNPA